MRKFLISAALVSTALTAAPAMAQDYGRPGYDQRDDQRDDHRGDHRGDWNRNGPSRQAINELLRDLDRVEARIERSVQRRIISRREAFGLRREASQIRFQLNRAMRNGINNREFFALRAQVNRLGARLRDERNDRDGRRY
ncbi:MAG: hypothetical protein QOG13_397 [Sphingomonadales bacterium]|jgi:hypothetical protein|nr:hypothetical protein [Sphingomonadales bacterium]